MNYELIFTAPQFQQVIERLAAQPTQALRCSVGYLKQPDRLCYLVRQVADAPMNAQQFLITTTNELPSSVTLAAPLRDPRAVGQLAFGLDSLEGHLWGVARDCQNQTDKPTNLGRVLIYGAGLPELQIAQPQQRWSPQPKFVSAEDRERWSRTINALGFATWRRLTELKVAVIGCGRTGSHLAQGLARLGARQILLIDADRIELHNFGEMAGVTRADVGRAKAVTLARFLAAQCETPTRPLQIETQQATLKQAYRAAWSADVLLCAVDNDAARLAAAILAALGHKILLDIGAGVRQRNPGQTNAEAISGADVRLLLPGHGCLKCFGGFTNYEAALRELCNERPVADRQEHWEQRNGSSYALNLHAVGVALRLLEEVADGRLNLSVWERLRIRERTGVATQVEVDRQLYQAPARPTCDLCQRAGMGDLGLAW